MTSLSPDTPRRPRRSSEPNRASTAVADNSKDRQFVTALGRGLDVLRVFTAKDPLLGNREIAARTGLPKPTISRLTHTLTKLGYLSYSDRLGKYQLGTGVLGLGYSVLSNMAVRQIARPFMQELAEYSGASVSLGSRDRLHMIYVEHCRPTTAVTLRLDLGSRIPIATTAMGRSFLAVLPEIERQHLIQQIAAHDPERWPRMRPGIDQGLEDFRKRGFTLSVGDWQSDVYAVGVPLIPPDGSSILAFNCGGPSFLLDRKKLLDDLGPRLVNLVRNVEAALLRG
jgi:DNA-binding IclR family transcriptional regulator